MMDEMTFDFSKNPPPILECVIGVPQEFRVVNAMIN